MNILMVLSDRKYPPDGRVEREARDLIRDGHNVFLMARRVLGQSASELVDGVKVIRVPLPFQRKKMAADFFYNVSQRYYIFFCIISACRRHKIDALHVHDLPYAFATSLSGKLMGIPFIFDMHEHYTSLAKTTYDTKHSWRFKPFAFLLLTVLHLEEKLSCRWAKKVIVVADEHIPRIMGLGVPRDNIVVVTNTEDIDYFNGLGIDKSLLEKYHDEFVILYFGGITVHRGLDTAIQAAPMVLEKIPNARLMIVGSGYSQEKLQQLAVDIKVDKHVTFTGFKPFKTLPSYIQLCKVGLIPHISTPHIETTMPNKIFQFMMLGKPVIVSNTAPMMRVVNDAECGLIFNERNAQSLAEKIIELKDENKRTTLGENGRKAVEDRYNWQQTVQSLLTIYHQLQQPD